VQEKEKMIHLFTKEKWKKNDYLTEMAAKIGYSFADSFKAHPKIENSLQSADGIR
jgi:hypothetical protein